MSEHTTAKSLHKFTNKEAYTFAVVCSDIILFLYFLIIA